MSCRHGRFHYIPRVFLVEHRGKSRDIPLYSTMFQPGRSGVLHYIPRLPFVGNRGIFHYIPRQRSRGKYYRLGIFRYIPRRKAWVVAGIARYSTIFRDEVALNITESRSIPLYSATERLVRKTKNPRPARPPSGGDTDQLLRKRATLGQQTARKRWSFRADNPDSSTGYSPLRGSIRHCHGFWSPFGLVVKRDGVFAPRFNERASARRGCAWRGREPPL